MRYSQLRKVGLVASLAASLTTIAVALINFTR